ncbi:MAG TPA: hypothetical protein VIH59_14935 [Candidatus Tectomicrobia bacterium]|jgi:hypothetical protein
MPKRNISLVYEDGTQLQLFCEADDGHPFALNRAGLVAAFENLQRLRHETSAQWHALTERGFLDIVIDQARRLHERALETNEQPHIHFTWQQYARVLAVQQRVDWLAMEDRMRTLRHHREAGEQARGVPRGMEEDAFRRGYSDAYQKCLDRTRRNGGRLPTKQDIADEMLIHRKTLRRNLVRYRLPWPPASPA